MNARHYDVVVLGRSIGALLTAALLSRRELRVLVLGHGERGPSYRVAEHTLVRRSFSMLAMSSPTLRRILQELAQTQRMRRMLSPLDPMLGFCDGKVRFDIPPDVERFSREVSRELAEIERPLNEFYGQVSEFNSALDAVLEKDLVLPPGSLWERVETGRAVSALPLSEGQAMSSLFSRFPPDHPFVRWVAQNVAFSSHKGGADSAISALSGLRLHGSWVRGIQALPRDELDLEEFLIERIEAHGGTCRLRNRVSEIVVERGRVVGVREDGESSMTGASAIVSNLTGEGIADLSRGAGVSKRAEANWPELRALGFRFVVSFLARREGIPELLPRESFFMAPTAEMPHLHVKRGPCLDPGSEHLELITAETILSGQGPELLGQREAVLSTLRHYLPFIDQHILTLDSVHDGLPARLYEGTGRSRTLQSLDRIHLRGANEGPEPMAPVWSVEPDGYLGIGGEPIRGPISGTYLVGSSVLPGLGQEGEVQAAWGAARILTQKDRPRQRLRQRMWTKIETS